MKARTQRKIAFATCFVAMEIGLMSTLWMTGNPVFAGVATFVDLLVLYLTVTVAWELLVSGYRACRVLVHRYDLQGGAHK